jgi:hypothetical protein
MMKNKLAQAAAFIVAISGLVFGVGSAYAAPAFVNGGFEADTWTVGWTDSVSPTGWVTVTDGDWPQGVHNSADTTEAYTPFGTQFIALCARDCGLTPPRDYIWQTVSGFVIGEQYRLDFQQAAESHDTFAEENSIVNVSIAGALPGTMDFSADSVAAGNYFADWKAQSMIFTAYATSLTFTFAGVATEQSDVESGIDNISVTAVVGAPLADSTPVPTLSVYGLVLAMLGLLLVAIHRFRALAKRR